MRVGILSAAHLHVTAYATHLAALDDVELAGIADEDPDRARAFSDEFAIPHREADELLADCEAAVVCAPNANHRTWVERAADADVPVLCEKPLATSTADAVAMVEHCRAAGVELGVAMPLRFSPPARRAREALANLGELQFVVGWNRGMLPDGWFLDPEAAGGGAVQDHTVHLLDLVRWFTDTEVREVYAETATGRADLAVEDVNVLSMALTDGTPFTLDGSWSKPDGWHTWGDAGAELVGTEGVVEFEHTASAFELTRDDADPTQQTVAYGADANERLVRDFIAAVRDGRPPETTGADGVREVAVVEAAYESAELNEPVTVEYPD